MAKLKGPLFSLGASGAIAKTLVYFGWKGLNVSREYVVPSNPQTASQVTQRGYMTEAVAAVHSAQANVGLPLNSTDQIAYAALAQAKGKIMTWFNMACKLWVDVRVATKVSCIYRAMAMTDKATDSIHICLWLEEKTASTLAAGKFYFGTSKTNLINAVTAVVAAGNNVLTDDDDCSAFLTAGVKYYVQFRPDSGDGCEGADSGIYNFVAE